MTDDLEPALSPKQKDILASYGGTLIMVQTTERVIKTCLTYVLQKDGELTIEKLRVQTKEEAKKTLGYFLSQLHKRAEVEPAFDGKLREFLSMRNDFTHNLAAIDGLGFSTEEELVIAEAFVTKLANLAQYISMVFTGLMRAWQKQNGMRDNFSDNEFFQEIDREFAPEASNFFFKKPIS